MGDPVGPCGLAQLKTPPHCAGLTGKPTSSIGRQAGSSAALLPSRPTSPAIVPGPITISDCTAGPLKLKGVVPIWMMLKPTRAEEKGAPAYAATTVGPLLMATVPATNTSADSQAYTDQPRTAAYLVTFATGVGPAR